jgi:hypothetical protein
MENGQLNLFEPGKDGRIKYRFFNNDIKFTEDQIIAVIKAGQIEHDKHT